MFLKQSEASAQSLVTRHKYSILFPPVVSGVKHERRERERKKRRGGSTGEDSQRGLGVATSLSRERLKGSALKIQTRELDGYSSEVSDRS